MNVFQRLLKCVRDMRDKRTAPHVMYAVCIHEGQILFVLDGNMLHLPFHTVDRQNIKVSHIPERLRVYLTQRFPKHVWHIKKKILTAYLASGGRDMLMPSEPARALCHVYLVGIGTHDGFCELLRAQSAQFISDVRLLKYGIATRTSVIINSITFMGKYEEDCAENSRRCRDKAGRRRAVFNFPTL